MSATSSTVSSSTLDLSDIGCLKHVAPTHHLENGRSRVLDSKQRGFLPFRLISVQRLMAAVTEHAPTDRQHLVWLVNSLATHATVVAAEQNMMNPTVCSQELTAHATELTVALIDYLPDTRRYFIVLTHTPKPLSALLALSIVIQLCAESSSSIKSFSSLDAAIKS
jgi:xanthine/CO dehydrogenase XdhC/CoxF family maturation factor